MDYSLQYISQIIIRFSLFLVVLCSAVKIVYSFWWKPKRLEKKLIQLGFRGTPYKLIFGDMKELAQQFTQAWSKPINLTHQIVPRVDPFSHYIVQKYGKMGYCWLGTTPRLIIMDPELIKEVFSNKLGNFQKPPLNPLILILTRGLTTLQGEKWATHRRIINPAFHLEKLKGMVPVIANSCKTLIDKWEQAVGPRGTCEVDIWPEFQNLSGEIISRTAFGSNYEEGKKILELQKQLLVLVMEAMQTFYIPGFRFIPTKKNQRRKSLNKRITSMLRTLIERKENAMKTRESRSQDLLSILLQSNNNLERGSGSNDNKQMTMDDVIEECKQFYLAGQETTSSLLTWTIIVLAIHPDWQEKAREEILQVCGKKDPDSEAISRLKIITMILYEVQRLYSPVIAVYQHAYKDTKIGDTVIPKGVDIVLPQLLIHHDPQLWGANAQKFEPERFSQGLSKACKDPLAFFPFGWGPRTCIGQQFAIIEVKITLGMILQRFSFELSPSYTHAPSTVTTLQPQYGAPIILNGL